MFASMPLLASLAMVGVIAGLIAGIVRLITRNDDRLPILIIASLAGAATAALLLHLILDLHFYPRYLIYLLPAVAILTSAGIAGAFPGSRGKSRSPWFRWGILGSAAITAIAWTIITGPQRDILRTRSYTAFREVAGYRADEFHAGNRMLVCYGLGGRMLPLYARDALHANNRDELEGYIEAARRDDKQFILVYAYREFNSGHPELEDGFELIDDPELFSESALLPGIEGLFEFHVLELKK